MTPTIIQDFMTKSDIQPLFERYHELEDKMVKEYDSFGLTRHYKRSESSQRQLVIEMVIKATGYRNITPNQRLLLIEYITKNYTPVQRLPKTYN